VLVRFDQDREPEAIQHFEGSLPEFSASMASRGIHLPAPIGVDPPFFAFLMDASKENVSGYRWINICEVPKLSINHTYWGIYTELLLGCYSPPSREVNVFSFGNTPEMASQLGHLVVKGRKRANSSNPEVLKKVELTLPNAGLVSIVTDGFGIPLCCIETDHVDYLRFEEITELIARAEGEGDLSLAYWQQSHFNFFAKEAHNWGLSFDKYSEVQVEWFRVLKVFAMSKGQR
jgi:uncharacterized protein YhfF